MHIFAMVTMILKAFLETCMHIISYIYHLKGNNFMDSNQNDDFNMPVVDKK